MSQGLQPARSRSCTSGPDNITKILEKADQFTILMKLHKTTAVGDQINEQLNNSNNGLTVFALTDNAFGSLKAETLNSLSLLSMSQFQTANNPLRTHAGGKGTYEFPLNLETAGNSVNISTVVNNAALGNSIFSDNQLAVYPVDEVILLMSQRKGANYRAESQAPCNAFAQ